MQQASSFISENTNSFWVTPFLEFLYQNLLVWFLAIYAICLPIKIIFTVIYFDGNNDMDCKIFYNEGNKFYKNSKMYI